MKVHCHRVESLNSLAIFNGTRALVDVVAQYLRE